MCSWSGVRGSFCRMRSSAAPKKKKDFIEVASFGRLDQMLRTTERRWKKSIWSRRPHLAASIKCDERSFRGGSGRLCPPAKNQGGVWGAAPPQPKSKKFEKFSYGRLLKLQLVKTTRAAHSLLYYGGHIISLHQYEALQPLLVLSRHWEKKLLTFWGPFPFFFFLAN